MSTSGFVVLALVSPAATAHPISHFPSATVPSARSSSCPPGAGFRNLSTLEFVPARRSCWLSSASFAGGLRRSLRTACAALWCGRARRRVSADPAGFSASAPWPGTVICRGCAMLAGRFCCTCRRPDLVVKSATVFWMFSTLIFGSGWTAGPERSRASFRMEMSFWLKRRPEPGSCAARLRARARWSARSWPRRTPPPRASHEDILGAGLVDERRPRAFQLRRLDGHRQPRIEVQRHLVALVDVGQPWVGVRRWS